MQPVVVGEPVDLALRGEVRYWLELTRLVSDPDFLLAARQAGAPPVLLVSGFVAGDASLEVLRGWLCRRGSRTAPAGMGLNVNCAERAVGRLEVRLRRADLQAPLAGDVRAVAIYSRRDGIASWRACLDPAARNVEVDSSHAGMSVNRDVYRILEEEPAWSG